MSSNHSNVLSLIQLHKIAIDLIDIGNDVEDTATHVRRTRRAKKNNREADVSRTQPHRHGATPCT